MKRVCCELCIRLWYALISSIHVICFLNISDYMKFDTDILNRKPIRNTKNFRIRSKVDLENVQETSHLDTDIKIN